MQTNEKYIKTTERFERDIIQATKRLKQIYTDQVNLQKEIDQKLKQKQEIQVVIDVYRTKMRRIKKKKQNTRKKIEEKRKIKNEIFKNT
jgi:chromosome segregation ATPase